MLRRKTLAGGDAAAETTAARIAVSDAPVQSGPRRRLRASKRALSGVAMGCALALFMSACPGGDSKSSITVAQVPVDLRFGGVDKYLPPPPPPPPAVVDFPDVPVYVPPILELPDLNFDYEERPCTLTDASARQEATKEIPEPRHWELGEFLFDYKATVDPVKAGDKPKVLSERTTRRLSNMSAAEGQDTLIPPAENITADAVPPTFVTNENRRKRNSYRYVMGDGFTTNEIMWLVAPGNDPNGSASDIGFFLDRLVVPYTFAKADYPRHPLEETAKQVPPGLPGFQQFQPDAYVNRLKNRIEFDPFPAIKVLGYPVTPGYTTKTVGFDAVNRAVFTSNSRVVKVDNTVRACDEHQAAFKTEWTISIGSMPDLRPLFQGICGDSIDQHTFTIRELIKGYLIPGPVHRSVEIVARQLENEADAVIAYIEVLPSELGPEFFRVPTPKKEMIAALEPFRVAMYQMAAVVRQYGKTLPDLDGNELIRIMDEELVPKLESVCKGEQLVEAFALNRKFIDYEISGEYWFATQMGGFPIKEKVRYTTPNKGEPTAEVSRHFWTGEVDANIHFLDPIGEG